MGKIIAFCGLIGSGKDTAAQYLIDNYGFKKESFAGTLKDSAAAIFGWDRMMLDGATAESRRWRESVDTWWERKLDIPGFTPRYALQYLGTEVFRNHFHTDTWVLSLERKLTVDDKDYVITDCRFKNELNMVDNLQNSQVMRIKRGVDPDWFDIAKKAYNNDGAALNLLKDRKIHASEYSWAGYEFENVIKNDGSLQDLYLKLDEVIHM
jgi:hypothetical protein